MHLQLQSSPFLMHLSVLVEKDASCLDPPEERHKLVRVPFAAPCAAQYPVADLIILLKSNLESGL